MCVSGFASFPGSDPPPAVPRPMSVNPFTVSMSLQQIGLCLDSRKCDETLSSRGTSTPAEERPKTPSSDPADSSCTSLHRPPLGSQGDVNLWSCGHFDAFGVFPLPPPPNRPGRGLTPPHLSLSLSVPCLRVCEGVKSV